MTTATLTDAAQVAHIRPFETVAPSAGRLTDSERPLGAPRWFGRVLHEAATRLLSLDNGWDSYGGSAIDREVVVSSMQLLLKIVTDLPQLERPDVVPTSLGGVAFEWSTESGTVEIEVNEPGQAYLYFEIYGTSEEEEVDFRSVDVPISYLERLFAEVPA